MLVHALFSGLGRPTRRHLSRHGRPAPALGQEVAPAYESERGAIYVMENLIVFEGSPRDPPMLLPRSYGMAALRSPAGELTALHDDPDAIWSWRPLLYTVRLTGTQRFGSQQEQEYRVGLAQAKAYTSDQNDRLDRVALEQIAALKRRYGRLPALGELGKNARKRLLRDYDERAQEILDEPPPDLAFVAARARAEALLVENLAPQQRIDLLRLHGFFVRGEINRLYFVEPGNGFAIVDPSTHETTVSLCLHPDEWMPHADVALATKLGIDAGRESEAELLGAAHPTPRPAPPRATDDERRAYEREEHYRFYP